MKNNIILEKHSNHKFSENILALDIGGTITQIGIIGIKSKSPYLAYSSEAWTHEIKNPYNFIQSNIDFLKEELGIKIKKVCVAIAGPINKERTKSHVVHGDLKINIKELKKKCKLEKALLLNDFEALGYSVNLFPEVFKEKKEYPPLAVIGAGTGLGKALLIYNGKYYVPHSGEGGHCEFPIKTEEELKLAKLITKNKRALQWEDLVSGKGLEHIYDYLRKNKDIPKSDFTEEIDKSKNKTFDITKHKRYDKTCQQTFKEFAKFYGRAAKNYALETLPYGGIYIAGGIVARNPEVIGKEFFKELSNLNKEQKSVIKNIPIRVINQKETSLLGCAFAILHN